MVRRAAALLLTLAVAACAQSSADPTPAPGITPTATPAAPPTATPPAATVAPLPTPSATPRPSARKGTFTIAFAGDVHFEGAIRSRLDADPATVFGAMIPALRAADLTVANLETAITEGGTPEDKQYVFRAPATAFDALRAAGIDVVTNANNHGLDYGQSGFQDTLAAATTARFPVIGSGQDEDAAYAPYRTTLSGWKVAVLGASQVIAPELVKDWTAGPDHPGMASAYRVDRLTRAVRQADRTADVVVVYVHWGQERNSCPTDRQTTLARQLVEAGADVVVGSHAHVVQGAGRLDRAYVAYGLGNFLFWSSPSRTSLLTLTMRGDRVVRTHRTPAELRGGRTTPLTGADAVQEVRRQEALAACAFG